MFMIRPKNAPEYTEEDSGLDIFDWIAEESEPAIPAEEILSTTIDQHDSPSLGHFAVVTVMTRDSSGHVHFLNGTI